jgi:hypothetical protein
MTIKSVLVGLFAALTLTLECRAESVLGTSQNSPTIGVLNDRCVRASEQHREMLGKAREALSEARALRSPLAKAAVVLTAGAGVASTFYGKHDACVRAFERHAAEQQVAAASAARNICVEERQWQCVLTATNNLQACLNSAETSCRHSPLQLSCPIGQDLCDHSICDMHSHELQTSHESCPQGGCGGGGVDRGGCDRGGIDHAGCDHGGCDHGGCDHGGCDHGGCGEF